MKVSWNRVESPPRSLENNCLCETLQLFNDLLRKMFIAYICTNIATVTKNKDRPSSSEESSMNCFSEEDGWQVCIHPNFYSFRWNHVSAKGLSSHIFQQNVRNSRESDQSWKNVTKKAEHKWADMVFLNLMLAHITRYIPGTDKRRWVLSVCPSSILFFICGKCRHFGWDDSVLTCVSYSVRILDSVIISSINGRFLPLLLLLFTWNWFF